VTSPTSSLRAGRSRAREGLGAADADARVLSADGKVSEVSYAYGLSSLVALISRDRRRREMIGSLTRPRGGGPPAAPRAWDAGAGHQCRARRKISNSDAGQ
jgi:hypothetical protein